MYRDATVSYASGTCHRVDGTREIDSGDDSRFVVACKTGLLILLVSRIALSAFMPLYDTTESRYGSIGLDMYRSGDWITAHVVQHGERVAFLAKPPLSFWLVALSFCTFGISEWASRLPSILAGLAILWAVHSAARHVYNRNVAWLSILVCAGSGLFFASWGMVMTDVVASMFAIVTMASWINYQDGPKGWAHTVWGHLIFLCMGLAMLAKGPIIVLLSLGPLFLWIAMDGAWEAFKRLPWITGGLLFLGISLPWYILEEVRMPGFLYYFFVNEHILRYLYPEYGDRYGHGHVRPYGTIWLMLVGGMAPWICLVPLGKTWGRIRAWYAGGHPSNRALYFALWALFPAVFFTLCRSVLPTYLLTGVGAGAILLSARIVNVLNDNRRLKWTTIILLAASGLCIAHIGLPNLGIVPLSFFFLLFLFVIERMSPIDREDVAVRLVVLAVGISALSVSGWLAGRQRFEERTTKLPVERALRILGASNGRVVVPYRSYYSTSFYGMPYIYYCRDPRKNFEKWKLADTKQDVFLIDRKRLKSVPSTVLNRIELIEFVHRYGVFRERIDSYDGVAPEDAAGGEQ